VIGRGEDKKDYNCCTIPVILLNNTNAIVRDYSLTFKVENIEKANLHYRYVVSILNPQGRDMGRLKIYYNQSSKIKKLKGKLYNDRGEEVRELSKNEIHDRAIISWATLYSDDRIRTAELYHNEYPYTIEFEYEIVYDGYINWPAWFPQYEEAAVEYSSYTVILPADSLLRYLLHNTDQQPVITPIDKKYRSYKWEIRLLFPFIIEPYGPPVSEQFIGVTIAPAFFKINDYVGSFSSWNFFGKWYRDLSRNRQNLPAPAREKIQSIINGLTDKKEKIRQIYKYMQSKTRYVSIDAGISAWQPVSAEKVFENGYGDCKALTNFMIALLQCADIRAYPALLYHDPLPPHIYQHFPYNQFNHVIVCVPCDSDTVWLECTSSSQSFGQIGAGNQNRLALLISDNECNLVNTPTSSSVENRKIRKAVVSFQRDGTARAEIETRYSGNQKDQIHSLFSEAAPDEIEEWLKNSLGLASYHLQRKNFSTLNTGDGTCALNLDLIIPLYASVSGTRWFFKPNLLERHSQVPDPVEVRTFPVLFSYAYCNIDSITYVIPAGYTMEAFPESVHLDTDFAEFKTQVSSPDTSTICYTRYFEIKSTQLAPQKYDILREFLKSVVQSDNFNVVLVKK